MTLDDIIKEIKTLSQEERKRLIYTLVDTLGDPPAKPYSVLDFAGIGAELYDGTDAQDYVNQLRSEWDDRP